MGEDQCDKVGMSPELRAEKERSLKLSINASTTGGRLLEIGNFK